MSTDPKPRQSFPLRLSPSLRNHAINIAQNEGISLNYFISLAIAEKVNRMEHETWLAGNDGEKTKPALSIVPNPKA